MQSPPVISAGGRQILARFRRLTLRKDNLRVFGRQSGGLGQGGLARGETVAIAPDGGGPVAVEIHPGDIQPRRHEIRVELDGGLQQPVEFGQRRPRYPRPEDDLARLEVIVVGVDVGRRAAGNDSLQLRSDGGLEGAGDLCRKLLLNRENVAELAIVGFGPDMFVGGRADELAGHTHLVAGPPHTALKHIVDSQLLGNLPDGLRGVAILHDRSAGHDVKLRDERQIGENILLDAIGEERAVFFLAHVAERENRQRLLAGDRLGCPDHDGRRRSRDRPGGCR